MQYTRLAAAAFSGTISLATAGCGDATRQSDWQPLFNGQDLHGWTAKINHHESGSNFADTFRVENNMIIVRYDGYGDFNEQFGHLFYNKPLQNFHLKMEYRFTGTFLASAPSYANANSGVMFLSQAPATIEKDQNWPISIEMQFLAELESGKDRPTGAMCSPGTDIRYQGSIYPGHCLTSSAKTYPMEQWVSAELIVNHGEVTHIINGETVLQYEVGYAKKDDLVTGESPAIWESMSPLESGYIALQSEGQPIDFRNIMLIEL